MYISHKSNVLQQVRETEWECRCETKKMSLPEYWAWLASVTTVTGTPPDTISTVDLSGETGYTIVECTDEDVFARLDQLGDYVAFSFKIGRFYNIKWSDSKVSAVTGKDMAGKDITIQTHFTVDDTAKDARLLADKWVDIRRFRDKDLESSDWTVLDDSPLSNANKIKWQTYRQSLRDVPSQSDPDNIIWPSKP